MSLIEHTNNTYRTWLTNAGDFGINRSVPAAKLHVQNSGNIFRCGDGTAVFNIYCDTADVFGRQFLMGTTTADGLTFITNNNVRGSIQSNGYWAIGSGSDALYPLHVLYNRATGAGTLTYRWYRSDGNNGSSTANPSNVAAKFEGRIVCNDEGNEFDFDWDKVENEMLEGVKETACPWPDQDMCFYLSFKCGMDKACGWREATLLKILTKFNAIKIVFFCKINRLDRCCT